MDDIYKNNEECNPNKERKIWIVFDNMIVDMLTNKKLNPITTELFIRVRKLNTSLAFITQSYSAVPKNCRLNSTHYFIMKIPNKGELHQIAFNHSSDIDFQDFMINVKRYCKTVFTYWCYSCIRSSFMFQKESFRKVRRLTIELKIKNYKMILTKQQQKYQHYLLEKLINMNINIAF